MRRRWVTSSLVMIGIVAMATPAWAQGLNEVLA
jgi:hypothetical protein